MIQMRSRPTVSRLLQDPLTILSALRLVHPLVLEEGRNIAEVYHQRVGRLPGGTDAALTERDSLIVQNFLDAPVVPTAQVDKTKERLEQVPHTTHTSSAVCVCVCVVSFIQTAYRCSPLVCP